MAREGVSEDRPEKKCVEAVVRIIRIEMLGWEERAVIISGSLMLATEPVAQRRRLVLRDEAESEERKGVGGGAAGLIGLGFVDAMIVVVKVG